MRFIVAKAFKTTSCKFAPTPEPKTGDERTDGFVTREELGYPDPTEREQRWRHLVERKFIVPYVLADKAKKPGGDALKADTLPAA